MKKIDKYLIKAYIPPFIVTFFIALFVLVMQFLWLYIDEIMGKGADIFTITELIFYLSVSLFPMAFPIAILISSVMVMGNLAERYELSSFKSAGVPLMRVMVPLMFFCGGISIFSYLCSDRLIPLSNLQFQSRLYDIRKQKPVLSLEEKVFNYDFQGFTIRINKKDKDNQTIHDVLIYDNNVTASERFNMIIAKRGRMYTTEDKQYMIMDLYDGKQYQELTNGEERGKFPFIRTNFKEWNKVFDLGQFSMSKTDVNLFKGHQKMMTAGQLIKSIDSIDRRKEERIVNMADGINDFFTPYKKKTKPLEYNPIEADRTVGSPAVLSKDTTLHPLKMDESVISKMQMAHMKDSVFWAHRADSLRKSSIPLYQSKPLVQLPLKDFKSYKSIIETFQQIDRYRLCSYAQTFARSSQNQASSTIRSLENIRESRVNHVYELHIKFSLACICLIFLFIGAPMGAIVQKGGFGYPILIAITFFLIYWIFMIYCKNLAKTFSMDPVWAAWLPTLTMIPIGLRLTYRAMNDYKLMNVEAYANQIVYLYKRIFSWFQKKRRA